MKKVIIIALVLVSVIAGIIFYQTSKTSDPIMSETTTFTITRAPISQTIFSDGVIASNESFNIYAETTAPLTQVAVAIGDQVNKGDVLAILNTSDLEQSLKSAEYQLQIDTDTYNDLITKGNTTIQASYTKALNTYELAKSDYNNNQTLFDSGVISKETLDNSKTSMDNDYVSYLTAKDSLNTSSVGNELSNLETKIELDQLNIDDIKQEIETATIKAPIDGTIVECLSDNNKHINNGELLFVIEKLSDLVVEATVSEYDINQVKINQTVIIETLGNDKQYSGIITEISPIGIISGSDVLIPVTIEITNEDSDLKPNFTANIEIAVAQKDNALIIPYEAITDTPKGSMVMITRDGNEMMIPIEKGIASDLYIEIISDQILEGDEIILKTYSTTDKPDPNSMTQLPGMGGQRPNGGVKPSGAGN